MTAAELVAIGDELVTGQIADTNSAWLARELRLLGIRTSRIAVVGDRVEAIAEALGQAASRAPLVIATGGLGPTFDDLTRDAAARLAGVGLERRAEAAAHLEAWFLGRGRPMPEANWRQADLPAGSDMLPNALGTAPGFHLRVAAGDTPASLYFLPGVPDEMEGMFRAEVLPRIRAALPPGASLAPFKVHLFGLWESEADRRLAGEFTAEELKHLGIRVSGGSITVAVYGDPAADPGEVARRTASFPDRLRTLFADVLFAEGDASLETALVEAFRAAGATIAVAESCTGGLVLARITSVPGASEVLGRGFVVYSDEAKEEMLGVPGEVLRAHGAVSEPAARAMAEGALLRARSDAAVAVTGIAGPTGGTPEKPVGLVWFAAAARKAGGSGDVDVVSFSRKFNGPRARIQLLAAAAALDLARRSLGLRN